MPIKVLLVDDHLFDSVLTMQAMADCRIAHKFVAASDGQEALDALAKHDFDLILLDIKMPRVDGLEFLQRLRRNAASVIPVIVLSSSNLEVDRQRAFSLNAIEYVHKAIDYSEFKDQLHSALARHGFC